MQTQSLLGDQIKYPVKEQQARLQNAKIFGYIDNSMTDPQEFLNLAYRGAEVLLVDSGVVLQNLAVRSAINKLARRPVLLWVKSQREYELGYLLGESVEAGISGADGVILQPAGLANPQAASGTIQRCRENGMSSVVEVDSLETLEAVRQLEHKPDLIFTYDDFIIEDDDIPGITHVHLSSEADSTGARVIRSLEELPEATLEAPKHSPLVKVCGIRSVEAAKCALDSGADMIGMILVPNRARTVDIVTAKNISRYVRSYQRESDQIPASTTDYGVANMSLAEANSHIMRDITRERPKIVGVFRNQTLVEILRLQRELELDVVQLHGSEPLEWCRMIPVPVIKRFTPNTAEFESSSVPGYHNFSLLDSELGGEGKLVDWTAISQQVKLGARFMLAGGLTPENVDQALATPGVFGVDVSGGVESSPGVKDLSKIRKFVQKAKSCRVGC
ncbi:hypothetical protein TRVA0_034S01530 [Trichomonascus vanleenenianus]|uniref:phosphoribosylanthranilate isomerase TRP1 n=1 Tax=Trichomonascus vanleenenianus TaxID=2268995 RepID=UPI003ECA0098